MPTVALETKTRHTQSPKSESAAYSIIVLLQVEITAPKTITGNKKIKTSLATFTLLYFISAKIVPPSAKIINEVRTGVCKYLNIIIGSTKSHKKKVNETLKGKIELTDSAPYF